MSASGRPPQVAALDELKAFLRVETAIEDALLQGFLRAATAAAEAFLGEALVRRECEDLLDPQAGPLRLAARPVREVLLVERLGGERPGPVEPGDWSVCTDRRGRSRLELDPAGGRVRAVYSAGLADDWNGVPEPVRLAVLRAAAHAFANRDDPDGGAFPPAFGDLLAQVRKPRL